MGQMGPAQAKILGTARFKEPTSGAFRAAANTAEG